MKGTFIWPKETNHCVFEKARSLGKMEYMQIAVLLAMLFAGFANGQGRQQRILSQAGVSYISNYLPRYVSGCDTYTCGTNAKCTISEGRPVCSCLNLHMGDPLVQCVRVECQINEDCLGSRACLNNKCIDPCPGFCGLNAECHTRDHVPTCTCLARYTGDPYTSCRIADPQAACKPSPCGLNTKCEVINEVPRCTCLPGYQGSPLSGCRHECESDAECSNHLACSSNFKCENPCQCGDGANCEVINHRPKCTCPNNWLGSPYVACRPECTYHSDCPQSKPACLNQKCANPCEGVCGINANCQLRDITPICSCPKDMTGDPFVSCRPFEPLDLCQPNPCGINAVCTPGHDNTGKERPVCTCPTGYIGNALISCQRGECLSDNECPDNRACIDFSCQNPCTGRQCGPSATCSPRRHIAVCTCPDGTRGDALVTCNPIDSRSSFNYARYYRYK
ncbi:neurogenic locus notch homolog protein 3 isoform X1 [Neodiprion pinetum]|uniref:neurogenic locus notch homolog protein 3 isoform X1 n=1 Tax=Neodiprion pinetum TaxID=441929 RepID=UPI001EDCFED1|nr:neurogenic locus notch homolog protein 1 isoform X1 [Neodiprion pinetum]